MRQILAITLLSAIVIIGANAQRTGTDAKSDLTIDEEHSHWLEQVMPSISTVGPGMTRRQILRVLTSEGGLYSRREGRYVYKHCPLIKVIVKFQPIDDRMDFSRDDKIVAIPKPFLEFRISD
ncbi:MAG TPA: hypothetical protein VHW45_18300 [Candidatus Sulfotelmatobacter sp.]|nr:hypothetical protein [Candidatus Sulfotelmatobacter sp.]